MKKIIWSIDPFSDIHHGLNRSSEVLKLLQKKYNCQIQPVYVLSLRTVPWVGNVTPPPLKKLNPQIITACEKWINKTKIKTLPPKILVSQDTSRGSEVKKLLSFSKKFKADTILVNTHARKGMSRILLGSFAETLLTHAKIPLLFVSPNTKPIKKLDKAIFATDFSKKSKKALQLFCKLTKGLVKSISLLNEMTHTLGAFQQSSMTLPEGSFISYDEFIDLEKKVRQKKSASFLKLVKTFKLKSLLKIETNAGTLSENIIEFSKNQRADMLALASESGTVSSLVLGSTARNVIRLSDRPVWVYHV